MPRNNTHRAVLSAIASNVIFGFSFIFSKLGLQSTEPSVLLAWRFLFAFALMNVVLLTGRARLGIRGKNIFPLFLLGVLQPVSYFLCESYGLLNSTATFSAVMIALIPIASMLFAAVFLRERPTAAQVFFSIFSILGVLLLSFDQADAGSVNPKGVVLLIGAIFAAVFFNAASRKSSPDFSPFTRTYFMMLVGAVFFPALAVLQNLKTPEKLIAPLANPQFLAAVLYLGGLSSVGAFILLNFANGHLPLARATAFANITTVVSVLAGVIFLREPFGRVAAVASIMIILSVYCVQKFSRPLVLPNE